MTDIWEDIQDHFESPFNYGVCQGATHICRLSNPSCGDSVSITLRVENGYIMDVRFEADGCTLSQASASMLVREILGKQKIPTAQEWLEKFKEVVTPRKKQCVLLPIQALSTLNV